LLLFSLGHVDGSFRAPLLSALQRQGARSMRQALHDGSLLVFEDWQLTPEGAAIHRRERTAVIADVHLGYEWARGAAGDCVPAHSLEETLARLALLLNRASIARLVVAGDLVESARPCHRTDEDVRKLGAWLLARGVSLTVLAGNHDRVRSRPASESTRGTDRASVGQAFEPDVRPESLTYGTRNSAVPLGGPEQTQSLPECHIVADWTISHGDRPIDCPRTISGHHHPALRIEGTTAPCFLIGPGRIILPAFSRNAAGCDLVTAALPREWRRAGFRCLASTGVELLDFGPLSKLRRLRAGGRVTYRRRS
jgi:uncharacterized protein